MATQSSTLPAGERPNPRAEYVLAGLAILSLALVPVHLTTIYSGLPAHPPFLHVPVILIPVARWAGQPTGRARAAPIALDVLAIACAYFVFHTGDLGAKAVWRGRLSGGPPGGGGGEVPQLFGPGGG